VVAEYEQTIYDELDLMREAANNAQLRRNFENNDTLYVPEIYFDFCRPEVMVQERIFGIQISDMQTLREKNVNLQVLAENGVNIFFTQVFRHNFFHADMHPGNIFVLIDDPDKPRYAAIDFGIVGTLQNEDKEYLAANFLAFFDRDYYRIAKLHLDSGWVPEGTRIDHLESAVRTVCEPVFNKPLEEISFAQVLMRLFRVAQRFEVEIQPQLVLLQKTLFNIEGLGRELYPRLDLWKTARPVLKQWMDEQVGPRAIASDIKENLPQIRQALRHLPVAMRQLSEQAANGNLKVDVDSKALSRLHDAVKGQTRQRFWLTLAASGIVAGTLALSLAGSPTAAWIGTGLFGAGVIAAWFGRPRS
jgi:ubiquinone biosynthesis protein